jgi:hypothetical protein
MQPQSQALIREFNRRLRTALAGAPNHVRIEAALEVESHVHDVLSRGTADLPEPEAVARVLAGFGSPEAYARALLEQIPAEVVSVGAGLRDVGLAVADLGQGTGRLAQAMVRKGLAFVGAMLRLLWKGLRWAVALGWTGAGAAATAIQGGVERSRAPVGRARNVLSLRLRMLRHGVRRAARGTWALAGGGAALLSKAWGLVARAVGRAWHGGRKGVRLLLRLVRWVLRAAGLAILGTLALLAIGVAGFAALAPDVAGWTIVEFQREVDFVLNDIRLNTIGATGAGSTAVLADIGTGVAIIALATALLLVVLISYVIWSGRRRRNTAPGH